MAAAKKNAKAPKKSSGQSASKPKLAKKQAAEQMQEGKVFISEADQYLFAQGTHYDIYKKLGAHPSVENGVAGMFFGVWAPNAASVHVIGTFNGWDENLHQMKKLGPGGIHALFIPGVGVNELYKFLIRTPDGRKLYKADPFANYSEFRPGNASKTTDLSGFKWTDGKWLEGRNAKDYRKEPMAIYECHIGSWMKHPDGTPDGFYNYRQFADRIVEYLKEMKYTHIELMGISEFPFDGSWGYQVTGYYAPTSRYGEPKDFMYLVNKLHENNVGVILDWVPAHFATDAHGLAEFDGQCIFEHPDKRLGEHPDWGTKIFNYGKTEVKNFLIANALFWLKEFHVDGIRVDAVASMLYLDYGKQDGQWVPNKFGGNKNLEAIEFFKHLNSVINGRKDGAMIIAEESTAWPKVTHSPEDGGLGFTFKWNMGWMHDFLEYMKLDPYFRKHNHNKMTFGITYSTSENFILVLSHDEVVHLKCSMINKMPGEYEDKFANLKAGYTFMLGHPGKKLLFMGQDFGQLHEWDEKTALDWYLADEPLHGDLQNYVRGLLTLYKKYPALYRQDNDWDGFQWINANDADRSIFSFIRRDETKKKNLLFICNFTPIPRDDYRVGVPKRGNFTLLLDNEHGLYEKGDGPAVYKSSKGECDGQPYSFSYPLPAYGTAIFRF